MTAKKKLIEVALPLEAINRESAHEKDVKVGKPTSVHHWWARRPLAACRAVLFAALVDDPSSSPAQFPSEAQQAMERKRLFTLIEELIRWENSNDGRILDQAREEIQRSTEGMPPPVVDPFCGGGSIPLEAQRLGLQAFASDLNPVAVLITKALIEIPPRFAGRPPVNPDARNSLGSSGTWTGAQGLAADVQYYGNWIREQAERRIGHLYPKVTLPHGNEETVIAWLWARHVACPNPACAAQMPLVKSFTLSGKRGKRVWVQPLVDPKERNVRFAIQAGEGEAPPGTIGRQGATCLMCGTHVPFSHIRAEGTAGRIRVRLMAIAVEGPRKRIYLEPDLSHEAAAALDSPGDTPASPLPDRALGFRVQAYGFSSFADLFTPRQLHALMTFSDLAAEASSVIEADARKVLGDDRTRLADGGLGARAYGEAVATYLGLAVDRLADWGNSLCHWENKAQVPQHLLGQQNVSMAWDFAEANPFSSSTGSWRATIDTVARSIRALQLTAQGLAGEVEQLDATRSVPVTRNRPVVVTDPPYYDNVGYADLSDIYYVWLRRSLGKVHESVLSTLQTPKSSELVAAPERFGGDAREAQSFFQDGFEEAFARIREAHDDSYPICLFYAFKQSSADETGKRGSQGWESMLEGLLRTGLGVVGTWPMRTEMASRRRGLLSNALASSIVLVCRPRRHDAPIATRREFVDALRAELPLALRLLQEGNIAPVDLAQAAIGPGMAVFSRYAKVVEASGEQMSVRTALSLINQVLDEVITEQESEFDAATRFAIAWFETRGLDRGPYGEAEVLAKAKGTTPETVAREGFLEAKGGKVRLLHWSELPEGWDPTTDRRLTYWEATHYLIRAHQDEETGSEQAAADLLRRMRGYGETARDLAYRLYVTCDRKGWAELALSYNALVVAWPEITRLADAQRPEQTTFGG